MKLIINLLIEPCNKALRFTLNQVFYERNKVMEIRFNINQYAKVKLTEMGKEILLKRHNELNDQLAARGAQGLGMFILKLDEGGYYKDQLWRIMQVFGEQLFNGAEVPFETEIILINESL